MATTTSTVVNSSYVLNASTLTALQWSLETLNSQQSALVFCLLGLVTNTLFWVQVFMHSSYRQRNMQWIYVYLIDDQCLIFRFLFSYIVHSSFYQTASNATWTTFICFFDAAIDNYLNIITIYILFAINVCRYFQIVYNRNIYQTHPYLLIAGHIMIYSPPIIILVVQLTNAWAEIIVLPGESCDIGYITTTVQFLNIVYGYIFPIFLNIFVILLSLYYIHLKTYRNRAQIRISARDKYHRSLVIQFLLFYIIWLALWSPDVLVYQFTTGASIWTQVSSTLNYVGVSLDPIIIAALDVRIRKGWISMWQFVKKFYKDTPARIVPLKTGQKEETRY